MAGHPREGINSRAEGMSHQMERNFHRWNTKVNTTRQALGEISSHPNARTGLFDVAPCCDTNRYSYRRSGVILWHKTPTTDQAQRACTLLWRRQDAQRYAQSDLQVSDACRTIKKLAGDPSFPVENPSYRTLAATSANHIATSTSLVPIAWLNQSTWVGFTWITTKALEMRAEMRSCCKHPPD